MPFSFTNALATFQKTMNKVFSRIIGDFIVVYLDDLNVYSRDFNEYLVHLKEVFAKIAAPLKQLMRKENSFEWKEEQQKAFEELKNQLISASILSYPDFE